MPTVKGRVKQRAGLPTYDPINQLVVTGTLNSINATLVEVPLGPNSIPSGATIPTNTVSLLVPVDSFDWLAVLP